MDSLKLSIILLLTSAVALIYSQNNCLRRPLGPSDRYVASPGCIFGRNYTGNPKWTCECDCPPRGRGYYCSPRNSSSTTTPAPGNSTTQSSTTAAATTTTTAATTTGAGR